MVIKQQTKAWHKTSSTISQSISSYTRKWSDTNMVRSL